MTRPTTSPQRVIGGRYAVLGELGRGGMGVVWRAEDRVIGRQVAVKELHLSDGLSPDDRHTFRERLLREARAAGRLSDPAIVTVYDVVTDDGVDHIVMELIEARTLADVVEVDGPLDDRSAAAVALQLLSALRVAHDAGVTHRDVKPGNVMLAAGGRVKLTDFGIAKAADDTRLTRSGMLIGSPGYLAPEQLDGEPASASSDLWALGATLYYAVEGRAPFAGGTTAAIISAVLKSEIPPISVSGPLGSVVAGLLQRDPAVRLTGAQATALLSMPNTAVLEPGEQFAERSTTPLSATRLTAAPVPGRRRRRWPWALVALVIGAAAGVAGTLTVTAWGVPQYTVLSYGEGGDLPELELSQGKCYLVAPAKGRRIDDGASRDCDEVHDSQVFRTLGPFLADQELPAPDPAALRAYGVDGCRLQFDSVVAGDDQAGLAVTVLVPSPAAFALATESYPGAKPAYEDRLVYCVLGAGDGSQLTGSRVAVELGN